MTTLRRSTSPLPDWPRILARVSPERQHVTAVFLWSPPSDLQAHLRSELAGAPVELVFPPPRDDGTSDEDALVSLVENADALVGWRPTKNVLDAAVSCRLVITPATGVQHLVPLMRSWAERSGRDVQLANSHGNAAATAQHAVALLLSLSNRIVAHHNWMVAGEWRRGDDDLASVRLDGRSIGFVGYGAINRRTHRLLSGFDARFSVLNRRGRARPGAAGATIDAFYGPGEIDRFLELVDVVLIAVPLTDETEGLVGARELAQLGPAGLLINVARGPVVDEAALFEALRGKRIAGAGLDVWYDYAAPPDDDGARRPYHLPFHDLDNVVLSPHRAASPMDSRARWRDVVDTLRRFAANEHIPNAVDLGRGY